MRATVAIDDLLTGQQLLAMGDVGPCELIDGRIVPMSPTGGEHGFLEFRLARFLGNFVEEQGLGLVLGGEVGLYTRRNPDRVRGADIAVVSRTRLPQPPQSGFLEIAPELVVEIMSPDDRWGDVKEKIDEYFEVGVLWVWIVEARTRSMLVFRSATSFQKLAGDESLRGEGFLSGFELPLARLFGD